MKHYHTISTPPQCNPDKTIWDVPSELLVEWSFKLFALMNLAWDYIDTICDACISLRIQETKPLVRQIRTLKREYDQFRAPATRPVMEHNETQHGLRMEQLFRDDLRKLMSGIKLEVNKLDLTPDHRLLVISVQQALTLMDAVKTYARWCDSQIHDMGIWTCDCCMVQTAFLKLYDIVPQFAGDCYQPDINARKLTAGILANRMKTLGLEQLLGEDEILRPIEEEQP